jgi:brefeldin A-resistance guanine nucleotide exchange factor 1
LKNVLLVLSSAQLLVPPPTSGDDGRTPQQVDLWEKSHARIGRILPGFLEDFVAQQPEPPVSAVSATAPTPTAEVPKEETKIDNDASKA